jgi:hypothetical protein
VRPVVRQWLCCGECVTRDQVVQLLERAAENLAKAGSEAAAAYR